MKIIVTIWWLVLSCFLVRAQTVIVKDKDSHMPLEYVIFTSAVPKAIVSTNSKGQANLAPFEGSNTIEVRLLGFKTITLSFAEIEGRGYELFLSPSRFSMDEIVVSASKWGQSKSDVPNKITTLSPKDVALQNPQTAADLLGATGEVFIQKSQQGGGSPLIRGFATNRLLYTIDGVRMNTAIFRAGNIQNVISLDAFAIENTEVFFGPGAIIYGSDAIGGVMSFQTLTPSFVAEGGKSFKANATTRYSSANSEKTGHVDFSIGSKKIAATTSFTYTDFGDLRMGNNNGPDDYLRKFYVVRDTEDRLVVNDNPLIQRPTGYSQTNFMQKVRFKLSKDLDIQTGYHFSETSEYSRYDRLIEYAPNSTPLSAVWNYGPQKWNMSFVSLNHIHTGKLYDQLTLRLAQQYFEESRIDRRFSGGNRFRLRTQSEEVKAYSANVDFMKFWGSKHLYYGVEAVRNDVTSIGSAIDIRTNAPIAVADRYPQSKWTSLAAYTNFQQKLNPKMLLRAGARYSHNALSSDFTRHLSFFPFDFASSSSSHGALTGSLGAVYTPAESWVISTNASTGFRAPNVDDVGKLFDFVSGEVVVPNTSLKSEHAYNAEFSIVKVLSDMVKLDLTGFYTQLENAMVRRAFQVNGQDSILFNGIPSKVYAIQNAANANVYGFHAGVEVKLPKGFGISSKYNFQLGKEEMDNGLVSRSRHAAPAFGVTRFTFESKKLNVQLYSMYSAGVSYAKLNEEERQKPAIYAKDNNGNPYSPGWYTLNFKGLYNFTKNFTMSAGLENITDQRYRPYSSGLVAPGRNLVFSLTGRI